MSVSPEAPNQKASVPASLPFLVLGALSLLAAIVVATVTQNQGGTINDSLMNVMIYGGLGTMVLGGVADQIQDRVNTKTEDGNAANS